MDQCWTPVLTPVSFKCWTPVLDTSGLNVTSVELQLQVVAKSLLTTALHAGNAQQLKPPYFNFWAKWDCCENAASFHLQILNTGFCYFKVDGEGCQPECAIAGTSTQTNVRIYSYRKIDANECPNKWLCQKLYKYLNLFKYSNCFHTLTHFKCNTNKCPYIFVQNFLHKRMT